MKPMGRRIVVTAKGDCEVFGVDFSSRLTLKQEADGHLVIHQSGGTHWAGRGEQAYHSPALLVYKVFSKTEPNGVGSVEYEVDGVTEISLARKK